MTTQIVIACAALGLMLVGTAEPDTLKRWFIILAVWAATIVFGAWLSAVVYFFSFGASSQSPVYYALIAPPILAWLIWGRRA